MLIVQVFDDGGGINVLVGGGQWIRADFVVVAITMTVTEPQRAILTTLYFSIRCKLVVYHFELGRLCSIE